MLKQLLKLFLEKLDEHEKKDSAIHDKVIEMVDEINELEEEYAKAIADAERWGDITDNSHWRTVKVNRIKRVIQAKKRMIDTLK